MRLLICFTGNFSNMVKFYILEITFIRQNLNFVCIFSWKEVCELDNFSNVKYKVYVDTESKTLCSFKSHLYVHWVVVQD